MTSRRKLPTVLSWAVIVVFPLSVFFLQPGEEKGVLLAQVAIHRPHVFGGLAVRQPLCLFIFRQSLCIEEQQSWMAAELQGRQGPLGHLGKHPRQRPLPQYLRQQTR